MSREKGGQEALKPRGKQAVLDRCDQTFLPGTVLGAYRIIELLGEGGMARVYHAEHIQQGRPVALKVLNEEYGHDPHRIHRFFAEARAANQVNHENIVQIMDFVKDHVRGAVFLVMEKLHGVDLLDVMNTSGALPPPRIVNIARQVGSALTAAHDAGIVHRDLKPENIFVVDNERWEDFVKILDFGAATLHEDSRLSHLGNSPYETSPESVTGTPAYMSPEQACGRSVDHRSDIYSFGIILYQMVTGTVPFDGNSFGELVVKHTVMSPPIPSRLSGLAYPIPPVLEALILWCLEKEPARRPQSVGEVCQTLQDISDSSQDMAPTFDHSRNSDRPPPRDTSSIN